MRMLILLSSVLAFFFSSCSPNYNFQNISEVDFHEKTSSLVIEGVYPKLKEYFFFSYPKKINKDIQNEIKRFKNKLKKEARLSMDEANENGFEFYPYEGNVTYEILYNAEGILSFYLEFYSYTKGAHGFKERKAYNYDLKKQSVLSLKHFFKEDIHYVRLISEKINKKIDASSSHKYFSDNIGRFKTISEEQSFFIMDEGIVIYFGLYEIAPYSEGFPEFYIPFSGIKKSVKREYYARLLSL